MANQKSKIYYILLIFLCVRISDEFLSEDIRQTTFAISIEHKNIFDFLYVFLIFDF